jgi:hypothetical protein
MTTVTELLRLPAKSVLKPAEVALPLMAFLDRYNTALAETMDGEALGRCCFMQHVGCDVLMAGTNKYDGVTYFLGRLSFEGRPLALLQFGGRHQRPTIRMEVCLTDADAAERLVSAIRRELEPNGLAAASAQAEAGALLDFGGAAEVSLSAQTLRFREQEMLLRLSRSQSTKAVLLQADDGSFIVAQRQGGGGVSTRFGGAEEATAEFMSAIERETAPSAWPIESDALVLTNRGNTACVALVSGWRCSDMECQTVGDGDPEVQAAGSEAVPVFSRLARELVNTTLALAATDESDGPRMR